MLDKKVEVNIIGKVDPMGFYQDKTQNGNYYSFFCIRSFSAGKMRNIPCIYWEKDENVKIGNLIKIKGELSFVWSKVRKISELKVNIISIEKL